jgi:hypothetical protein
MGKKVIRISEQDLSKILSDVLNMTGIFGVDKMGQKLFGNKKTTSSSSDSDVSDIKISAKGQELLNNPIFKKKLKEISSEIGISENSIIKLMEFESRLDSSIKNSIGCVGLIQFCPDNDGDSSKTINGKKYNLSELQGNLELQLDAIKEFWSKGKRDGQIKTAKDLYIYNFLPIAAGKSDDFVLQSKDKSAETIAKQNPIFNRTLGRPINTPLTVGDLDDFYKMTGMI